MNASFTDSITGNLISINGFSINSRVVQANADHSFHFGYDSTSHISEGMTFYGSNVSTKITGTSAADTLTQLMYMPKKPYNGSSGFPYGRINIANNLTLNWVPDSSNTWGKIAIKIWYDAKMSRFLSDSTLPAQDTTLSYIVPDNGSYTIGSSDLQKLKVNSMVHVSLGRGSLVQGTLPVSHKKVYYYASASESSPPITLVNH